MIGTWHLADVDATTGDANDPIEIDDKEEVIDVDEVLAGGWETRIVPLLTFVCVISQFSDSGDQEVRTRRLVRSDPLWLTCERPASPSHRHP
jgi:hypothetical protein